MTIMNLQDAMQLIKDDTLRLGMEVMSKATTIIFIVINVIFLGIVFYKIWRQQKRINRISRGRTRLKVDKG